MEELNALDAQADAVEAALSGVDDLEPLKDENEELEAIADNIEGVDELESIANSWTNNLHCQYCQKSGFLEASQ